MQVTKIAKNLQINQQIINFEVLVVKIIGNMLKSITQPRPSFWIVFAH